METICIDGDLVFIGRGLHVVGLNGEREREGERERQDIGGNNVLNSRNTQF